MNDNLTPEMLKKAKACASAEELLALAEENGIKMTAEESAKYYAQLHPKTGELGDDELDNVAGGCPDDDKKEHCHDCGTEIDESNKRAMWNYLTGEGRDVCIDCRAKLLAVHFNGWTDYQG